MCLALEQSPMLIILCHCHPFPRVAAIAKSSLAPWMCQGEVLSWDLVPLKNSLCVWLGWLLSSLHAECSRLTIFTEDSRSADLRGIFQPLVTLWSHLLPFLNEQPAWCHLLTDDGAGFGDEVCILPKCVSKNVKSRNILLTGVSL